MLPWTAGRCAPGFVCTDWPEPSHDIPGFCREPDEPCSDPDFSFDSESRNYESCDAAAAEVPGDLEHFDLACERAFGGDFAEELLPLGGEASIIAAGRGLGGWAGAGWWRWCRRTATCSGGTLTGT